MLIIKSLLFSGLGYSETLIKSHGISSFGNLKYSKDFSHLEYVNPNAPKSGEISTWAFGTFDSLNRYIVKGNAAGSGNIFIETLKILEIIFPIKLLIIYPLILKVLKIVY